MNCDCDPAGFEWIDCDDAESSVVSLLRKGQSTANLVVAVCNFTPVPRAGYRIGVPRGGFWREALNSDAVEYGGSGIGNLGGIETESRRAPWPALFLGADPAAAVRRVFPNQAMRLREFNNIRQS